MPRRSAAGVGDERLYDAMIAVSSRTLDKSGLARLIRDLAAATGKGDPVGDF